MLFMSSINHSNSKKPAHFSAILLVGIMASSIGFMSGCSQPEQSETVDTASEATADLSAKTKIVEDDANDIPSNHANNTSSFESDDIEQAESNDIDNVEQITYDNADIFDLKVGTCFDNEGEANEEVVSTIPIRNCNQPHDNEVFYVFKLPDAPSYQASEDSINAELDKCADAFNDYVVVDYQESPYELSEFTPTPESWAAGDREIVCFLYDPSGDKISESVKGSGFVAL